MDKFWVVWNPSAGAPSYRHNDRRDAITEAERLASNHQNSEFIVLEAITVTRHKTVFTEVLHDISDDLPF